MESGVSLFLLSRKKHGECFTGFVTYNEVAESIPPLISKAGEWFLTSSQ